MNAVYTILILFILTIPVAIVGFVYTSILTKPDHILEKFDKYLERHLPEWLYLPLIGCLVCCTGQISLWGYPLIISPRLGLNYNLWLHIYFVCTCIYNVHFIKYFWEKVTTETKIETQVKKSLEDPPEVKRLKGKEKVS